MDTGKKTEDAEVRSSYAKLTKNLIANHLTISTMESITSGAIASLITDTEGSSAVLKGAFVTYSNQAKIMQGVPAETIRRYGVYSGETARAMARACAAVYRADIGVGITGSAGNPDPNNADSVPGQIYYAIWYRKKITEGYVEMKTVPSRHACKMTAAGRVADTLLRILT